MLCRLRNWLGFGESGEKTGLDLLQFLVTASIPILVAFGGIWFTEQRAQDEALQAYFAEIGTLLVDGELLESKPGGPVQTVAQARTSNVLSRLDSTRKGNVVVFLHGAKLIEANAGQGSQPIISLRRAELDAVELSFTDLSDADLSSSRLRDADLTLAALNGANLSDASINAARLPGADLSGAELNAADVSATDLSGADLSAADLRGANLSPSDLSGADLSRADLRDADLSRARGLTDEQLEAALSLSGATMPDGSEHD